MMSSGWAAARRRSALVQGIVLGTALVTFLVPLVWTGLASFGVLPRGTYPPAFTGTPTLEHYVEVGVAEPGFWDELATSTGVAIAATLLTVAAAVLAGYALARSRFRGRRAVVQAFLILASLPVMAYAIPLGEEMRRLGLADSFPGLILGVAAVTSPLAVFVLFGQLGQLSVECEEAAWLDGAGLGRVLWSVVLPLARPAVAATAIVVFVMDWNLLLVPLVVASVDIKTIPVAMIDFFTFERELEWPTAAAGLMVSLVPLTILVALGHRWLGRFALTVDGREADQPA